MTWDGLYHIYRQHVGGNGKSVGVPSYYCESTDPAATTSWAPQKATCKECKRRFREVGGQLALLAAGGRGP